MKIIEHDAKYKRQLYNLINGYNRLIPPYVEMTDKEISAILEYPSHYLDLRFPNDGGETKTYLMIRNGEISCAAQVAYPERDAYFHWFVANPKYIDTKDIDEFVNEIKAICSSRGCQSLGFSKNTFGVGWAGIPNCWHTILEKVLSLGFKTEDLWEMYWLENELPQMSNLPPTSVTFEYENEKTIDVSIFNEHDKVGEATIWLPSELSESLNNFGLANLEYIEIYRDFRRKGYGQSSLLAILNKLSPMGFAKLMLWTELDNVSMKHLASSMGFSRGPNLHWILGKL